MKIYMMTDLEGVAGVTDFEDRNTDTHDNYAKRKQMQSRLLLKNIEDNLKRIY